MPYLLLIMEPHGQRQSRSEEEAHAVRERMVRFAEDLKARGLGTASESLLPDSEGVRVEVRGGKRIVVDGPFTESKEMVGGYFLLDCQTKEEAVAIACECPASEWATVEVRELGPCVSEPK